MTPLNQSILGGVLLLVGLVPLLAAGQRGESQGDLPRFRGSSAADGSPKSAPTRQPAPVSTPPSGCPRGQLDDFGVCVPVAQTPPRSHKGEGGR